MDQWFSPPVKLWLKADKAWAVTRVALAAEILLFDWPKEARGTAKHRAAREACLACLEGKGTAEQVRSALEAAAKEAGILH
ncbi:DUF982 domain-containing protein [Microvirga alba]|uniref:DUF982 domain-containing protein n=1 Tax=Microvirga alba TaxID=2791025 RepID=A0A931BRM4_9HYPH|nr:DUF982 domain-containing protein [Microvirga alba]MBF9233970.1 DUF982 domain-containing protein [Microvirga alba]